jgi:hypothetical protein
MDIGSAAVASGRRWAAAPSGRRWAAAPVAALAASLSGCALLGGFDLSDYALGTDAAPPVDAADTSPASDSTDASYGDVTLGSPGAAGGAAPLDAGGSSSPDAAGSSSPESGPAPPEAGPSSDAETPANRDASPEASTYRDLGIVCGTGYCDPTLTVCCYDSASTGAQICRSPSVTATQCQYQNLIECDDTADCEAAGHAGTGCCGVVGGFGTLILVSSCTGVGACTTTYGGVAPSFLCDPLAPNPCPNGAACVAMDAGNFSQCEGL